ncbi:dethiobiotin synthase [Fusobacterium sp.]|uniref:dethiobiotin synthase n=1 Tax=Fusobacterium sp. TaxID=68766 RepID=UPI0028FEA658|nr:dethiobiotin synthase [Fusobacterium sp.]MDU1911854.1 dethiobiotin synthase [Fusobacterium sp.]
MNLNKGYFIIGTDTRIGKTYVSALLYQGIKKRNGGYYKPIQSGAFEMLGKLVSPDVEFLCEYNKIPYDIDMTTYLLRAEVSPHLAAEIDKTEVKPEKIKKHWEKLTEKYDTLIVEGAGGLFVPIIREKYYMYDLIKMLDIPVIVVTGNKVGSINHTMLTVNALENMGIKIQGFIFNSIERLYERTGHEEDNRNVIMQMSGIENHLLLKHNQDIIDQIDLFKFLEADVK